MTELIIAVGFIVLCLAVLKKRPRAAAVLLSIYVISLVWLALLARKPSPDARYNLELFGALRRGFRGMLAGTTDASKTGSVMEVILNILVFIPAGLLLPHIVHRIDRWWKAALTGFALSLAIEVIQLVTHLGFFDIDDLFDNTLGALLGWLMFCRIIRRSNEQDPAINDRG